MNILFIGDIVGRAGRRAIRKLLPDIQKDYNIDLTVANGENSAGGFGITEDVYNELLDYNIDCLTMGNHTWKNKDIYNFIDTQDKLIRPLNFLPGTPGKGWTVFNVNNFSIAVINMIGTIYMGNYQPPLFVLEKKLPEIKNKSDFIVLDFHAEATGEKLAFAHALTGKIATVAGTHTHIQTADARILPGGTGYISDLGLTGAMDSILGMKKTGVIKKYRTQMPARFKVGTGQVQLEGAVFKINPKNGNTRAVKTVHRTDS
ncbi:MAG: TIGR00282 family metallophosphoesterase [Halanaerobiaceae bacterium]